MDEKTLARFWKKVDKTDGCWLWKASFSNCKRGALYGQFRLNGKMELAHRVSWLIRSGDMPKAHVLHHCDVTTCVRPDHLFEGTQADNNRDRTLKMRSARILTKEQALSAIRRSLAGNTHAAIAADLGVIRQTVSMLVTGKTWRWLHEEISTPASRLEK